LGYSSFVQANADPASGGRHLQLLFSLGVDEKVCSGVNDYVLALKKNSRRQLLLASASSLLLGLGSTAGWCLEKEDDDDDDAEADADFYLRWPYRKASDILTFVRKYAKFGDSDSVLEAMDQFGER
jgi:hypothetical protein